MKQQQEVKTVVSVAFFLHILCIEMLVDVITVAFLFLILA